MKISLEFTEDELFMVQWALEDFRDDFRRDAEVIRFNLNNPEYVAELPPGYEGELEGSAERDEEYAGELKSLAERMEAKLKAFRENKRAGDEG